MATKRKNNKKLRLEYYNLLLTRMKRTMVAGATFSAEDLAKMFTVSPPVRKGTYEAVHAENMRMLRLQKDLNKLLRKSGLYLRSSCYYRFFTVSSKDDTKRKIERMSAAIDSITNTQIELEAGVVVRSARKNWGTCNKLGDSDINEVLEVPTSTRHDRLLKRLSQIK